MWLLSHMARARLEPAMAEWDIQYKYVIWADALSLGTPRGFLEHGDKKFLKGNKP